MKNKKRLACTVMILLLASENLFSGVAGAGKANGLRLNAAKKTMAVGDSFLLQIKNKAWKHKKVTWKSSKSTVASVTKKGKVTAKKAGRAKITVKVRGTGKKAVCCLTVRKKPSSSEASVSAFPGQAQPVSSPGSVSASPDGGQPVPTVTTAAVLPSAQPSSATGSSFLPDGELPGVTGEPSLPVPTGEQPIVTGETARPAEPSVSPPMGTVQPTEPSVTLPVETAMPVDASVLVAAERLVTVNDDVMTAYVINKRFSGEICISLNGKEYSTQSSGRSLLSLLKRGAAVKENADGTIRVSRADAEEEYWTIEDLQCQRTYYLKADTANVLEPGMADCGVIYILGDVRPEIEISGRVQT